MVRIVNGSSENSTARATRTTVYGPWPAPVLRADRVRLVGAEELKSWVIHEDEDLLGVNKSGDVVCHPSKFGPTSSLVGAAREYTGLPTMHLVFRLDRETSGVVVMAKNAAMASRLQQAMQTRQVGKRYLALLGGELQETVTVAQPLGRDEGSVVHVKNCVREDGKAAVTRFVPVVVRQGFSVVEVTPATGRKHQIRIHAQWLGHGVVGDEIYGPDEWYDLQFIEHGWSRELEAVLLLKRQALHCAEIDLRPAGLDVVFRADWPVDLADFTQRRMDWSEGVS